MQKIIIFACIALVLGGIAGFMVGRAIYSNSGGTGRDQAALEESRRIIASQREALERLSGGAIESHRIIVNQQKEIDGLIAEQSKTQDIIGGAIENDSGAMQLSEDARSEIQFAIRIIEKIESRK